MIRVGNWRYAVPPLLAIVFTILAFLITAGCTAAAARLSGPVW